MTVPLDFTSDSYGYADCTLTVSGVMLLKCPEQFFVYNTKNFLATGLKGISDHGGPGNPGEINYVVEKKNNPKGQLSTLTNLGYDDYVGFYLGKLSFYSSTGAKVGEPNYHRRADAFKMTLAEYEFSIDIKKAVLYDMDYVILTSGNDLAFIVTKGLQKLMKGEKFGDADLQGKVTLPGNVVMLRGYSIAATDTTEY
jgi:hypothetical protein